MRTQTRKTRQRRAFTLLEVMMVLVILGVIAVLVLSQIGGRQDEAKVKAAEAAIKGPITSALEMYKLRIGSYPSTDEGLAALIEGPNDEEAKAKWTGGALVQPEQLKDGWGHDFKYAFPGQYNENGFDLSSAGPDGVEGNDDDIQNWKKT